MVLLNQASYRVKKCLRNTTHTTLSLENLHQKCLQKMFKNMHFFAKTQQNCAKCAKLCWKKFALSNSTVRVTFFLHLLPPNPGLIAFTSPCPYHQPQRGSIMVLSVSIILTRPGHCWYRNIVLVEVELLVSIQAAWNLWTYQQKNKTLNCGP